MRKLNIDDLFLLSLIADKMSLEFPNIHTNSKMSEQQKEIMHAEFGKQVITMLFKNMHKAKNEILQLISDVSEKDAKKLEMKELKEVLANIMSQEGVMELFK